MYQRSAPLAIALAIIVTLGTFMDAQAQSKTSFVEKVEVAENMVTFQTREGSYADVMMTVVGPDEFRLEHRFSGKERLSLPIKSEKGMTLPDGSYTIEMSARPNISEKQRAALDEARQKGDRYAMRQLMKEIGLDPGAMVYSMNLGVARGMFINPEGEQEEEPETDGKGMGALHKAPQSTPQIQSVQLTGRRWDAAYRPNAADMTGAAVQPAALAAETPGEALPFAQASSDPASAWYEATFQNTAEDGTPLTYQGFLRPVVTDTQGKLFQIYLRQADGLVYGPWQQGYFRADEGTFSAAPLNHAARPFDYVTDESTEAAEASLPFFHIGSGSIDGSLCVGNDCVANEAFGFDTIRMKENNLRLHYEDTSVAAAFPQNDWRVYANDSANGGSSYYGVEDATAGRFVFRVFAGARSNALTVDSQGDVGLGTTTPATDIDIKIGDTPTVRLQQDNTSGFTPQTWDLAGNETNFFIRDATGGSTLPFRIRPTAPTSSIDVAANGDVGMGTASPGAAVHVVRTAATAATLLRLENNGATRLQLLNTSGTGEQWTLNNSGTELRVTSNLGTPSIELMLDNNGDLEIAGTLTTSGTCSGGLCDGVFDPDRYEVPSIEEHAAFMWENSYLKGVGPTPEEGPVNISQKVGGILNELEHAHIYIEQLHKRTVEQQKNAELQQKTIEALLARLAALEKANEAGQEE